MTDQTAVTRYLREAGYSLSTARIGIRYAIEKGATTNDEVLSYALARLLYEQEDLDEGRTYPVEWDTIDWNKYTRKSA